MAEEEVIFECWYIPICIAIIGSLIDATGWIIEKKSHINLQSTYDEDEINATESIKYLCDCYWWFGFITHTFGTIVFSISLGIGKQTLITPLQSFTLLFAALFAWKYLNEKLTKTQILGTFLIIIGCIFSIAFGPKENTIIHKANGLSLYFIKPMFLLFSATIGIFFIINFIIYQTHIIGNTYYLMFCDIGFGAYFSIYNALFTKCFVEIIFIGIGHNDNNWTHWFTYICFLCIVITGITLEYWRQKALKMYAANHVSSIYNTFIIIGGMSIGVVFFREFQLLQWMNILLLLFGVIISFIGVGMLSFGGKHENNTKIIPSELDKLIAA